jgi:hypothetical protein
MAKPELEFFDPLAEVSPNWQPVAADATGQLSELVLSRDAEGGVVTRLLRFAPDTDTSANGTVTHDVWEEIWIVEGTLHDLRLNKTFAKGMYACRPPGMPHGPWRSDGGCLMFEVRYRCSDQ